MQHEKKRNNIWDTLQDQDLDPAAQLVAKYNGSDEIPEVRIWNYVLFNSAMKKIRQHLNLLVLACQNKTRLDANVNFEEILFNWNSYEQQ